MGIWDADRKAMSNNQYAVNNWANGKATNSHNGDIRMIEIQKNIDGISYIRRYNFSNGVLIFAHLEGADAHRLYFKNDKLFRWRYAESESKRDKAVNYDNIRDSEEYKNWENFSLEEAYRVYSEALAR